MLISVLQSKIHRAVITNTNIGYEGSCTIDSELMIYACIREYQEIHIYNVNNGTRFSTYAICALSNSGIIDIRGAGARLAQPGDHIIICTYAMVNINADIPKPIQVYVNGDNGIITKECMK